ncbi:MULTISPECIES: hypothetical protein [Henriciella]|jgi:hypothetical protein|uniref:Uncharacterized protein n=1 Tax=Henriciella marina TaxID=453851 RepID=A0ABT4LY10_9PROT|nr:MULTISPECIES: hypothetical protein [Henriciella]MCH2459045.1 hypothetical protein [Henriciella sp.]MCZ4299255.1 hypothetical protein [Henriciella marina]
MVDMVMHAAENALAPWWVLAGAALIITVEAARSCKSILWSDLGDDED